MDQTAASIDLILDRFKDVRGNLIAILHEIQSRESYLPEASLRHLAKQTGIPLTQIYAIATFYHFFRLVPKGKHQVTVCLGTACHVKGATRILGEVEKRLEVVAGETTMDRRYSVSTVRCVGACSFAPVLIVDKDTHGGVMTTKVSEILGKYE